MRTSLASTRRTVQWAINSRMGLRQPSLLMNSIPKSGTHLVISVLEGAGHSFAGHYGHSEQRFLSMSAEPNQTFATAHITKPITGPGQRWLIYRNPIDVALSMVIYIRSRADHPRTMLFKDLSLANAVEGVFNGIGDLEPLWERYLEMHDWALTSAAKPIDFDVVKRDPAMLLQSIGIGDFEKDKVNRAVGKWNPTKRTSHSIEELELKDSLRLSTSEPIRKTFDVYKKIKSLT